MGVKSIVGHFGENVVMNLTAVELKEHQSFRLHLDEKCKCVFGYLIADDVYYMEYIKSSPAETSKSPKQSVHLVKTAYPERLVLHISRLVYTRPKLLEMPDLDEQGKIIQEDQKTFIQKYW